LPGNNSADRRFAGSHEAHKGQVVNLPVTGHDSVLAQISGKFKVQTGTNAHWAIELKKGLQNFIFKELAYG
jgi:hypothetical protein